MFSSHMKQEKSSFCTLSASSEEHSVTTIAFHHSKASNTWGVEGGVRVKVSVRPKIHIQWNHSIVDLPETQLAVVYREVSLIQR